MRRTVTPQVESRTINWFSLVVQWFWRFIATSAADWRWSPLTVGIIGLLPLLIALGGVILAGVGKSIFKWVAQEDGVVEYLQVLFDLCSLLMALMVARYHWCTGNRGMAFLYGLLSLGFVFLMGEEISWGQRILGWETPSQIAAINEQDETNLHNLKGMTDLFKWVQFLVGVYGTLLPVCCSYVGKVRSTTESSSPTGTPPFVDPLLRPDFCLEVLSQLVARSRTL